MNAPEQTTRTDKAALNPELDDLTKRDYEWGFVTDIEQDSLPPGLDESTVRFISAKKEEPEWMLEWRLKAFRRWQKMEEPDWAAVDYPKMLILTGLHDSQVQYWEPAKWVAKLRETKTGDERVLFHVNMDAGHGGASGRFRRFKETALTYAWLLDLVDVRK